MAELKQIMDKNTMVLAQVVQRNAQFRASRSSRVPRSIFDMSFATRSLHSEDDGSVIARLSFLSTTKS